MASLIYPHLGQHGQQADGIGHLSTAIRHRRRLESEGMIQMMQQHAMHAVLEQADLVIGLD